jgi:transcription initiation factor TFIIA large subunit
MGWQQKLSQLQVATFPWDPKPEPTPQIANPPTVPSNAGNYQSMSTPPIQQPQSGLTMPQANNNVNQPRIKTEPGLEAAANNGAAPQQYQQAPAPTLPNATMAQQRAAQHLHQNYGPRAAASINAIQSGGQPQAQNGQQQGQMPTLEQMQRVRQMQQLQQQQQQAAAQGMTQGQAMPNMQNRPQMTQEQYRHMMAANAQRQMQATANGQNGVGGAQTDGAGDEVESLSVIKRFDANGEEVAMGRVEIDGMIRQKIEAMGSAMEGGGLMLPLHKASTAAKRSRKVKRSAQGMAQADGGDDDEDDKDGIKDEELDEDAINSDLDDPDDGLNEEEDEDEGMGHIMLCMYDKVQRVKNKWKCVMKDGVLTVNGKEYVFHKASGEYEW